MIITLTIEKWLLPITLGFFFLLIITGCSPQYSLPGQHIDSPRLTGKSVISFDGTVLPIRTWIPEPNPKKIIIALHGFNDYSNFIDSAAQYFNQHGIAVISYDQRGFGKSPHRGKWPGTMPFVQDLQTIIPLVKNAYPDIPVYVLGESMGGAVAIVAMYKDNHPEIDGIILVAPAVWGRATMPFYQRWALWIGAHSIPWKTLTGESLDIKASDNIEMLKKLGRDSLIIKETRIDTIYGLTNLMDAAYEAKQISAIPTLILYGDNDEVVPKKPIFDVFLDPVRAKSEHKFLLYKKGYHMLLRDLKSKTVLMDIVSWVDSPLTEFPSVQNNTAQDMYAIKAE